MNKFYPERQLVKLFFLSLFFSPLIATAQLEVTDATTPPFDPINLIENVFLGQGVDVLSVTYTGDPVAVGFFNGENSNIGIDRGIIMTSGSALNAIGPNTAGNTSLANTGGPDPDLQALIDPFDNTQNAAVYEITFRPFGDTLRFDYVFGSEEYDEFVCLFNDVFGFLISGPGYPIPTNIALVPGTTTPISVDNVNNGGNGCAPTNVAYYVNNAGGTTVEYDAFTTVLTAEAIVQPCMTYTIKIAIADVNDQVWDSGVFLAANSFGTNSIDVDLSTFSPDSTMIEGCIGASLTFDLGIEAEMDFLLDYTIFGSAINGVDYVFVPDNLFIPQDSTSLSISFDPIEDGIVEGTDTVFLDIQINNCERDTFIIFIDDNALVDPIADDITICEGDTGMLEVTYPLPLPESTTFNSTDTPIMINDNNLANPITSVINVSNVTPSIVEEGTVFSICVDITHNWVGDLDLYLITPGGQFLEISTDNGGSGDNYQNACFTETAALDITGLTGSFTPFTGEYLPESPWTDIYGGPTNGAWQLIIADDSNGFGGTLNNWSITFPPIYSISYEWGPADSLLCPTCAVTGANPLATTTYYVTATDTYGCFTVDSAIVNVINNIGAPNILCDNSVFGEITFSWDPVLGASGYEVNVDGAGWIPSNGGTSHQITSLGLGQMVTIEVQGTGGTCATASATLSCTAQSCSFVSILNFAFNPSCNGGLDGSAEAVGLNGTPPYTYTLGVNSQMTGLFSGLGAGDYTIFISDANGCGSSQMFTLGEPDVIQLTPDHMDLLCNGDGNGTASVTVTGGTAGYTYLWSDLMAQTDVMATGLVGDTYFVTVTDANSCEGTIAIEVLEPTALSISASGNDLLCNGTASGDVLAVVAGGTQPYTYLWSNTGETTDAITGLVGGSYSVTVTDANGCTITDNVRIVEPTALSISTSVTEASCNGGTDGSATVTAMNGTPGYTYTWDVNANNQTTAIATGLGLGSYIVTVTDGNGCEQTASSNIAEFASITYTMTGSALNCFGDNTGTAEATVTAGSPPYIYSWDGNAGNQTSAMATGLSAGTYAITISDATGCSIVDNAIVSEPTELQLSTSFVDINCNGGNDGSATVSPVGGTGAYTYLWSNGATDATALDLVFGTFTVTVTDANGCTETSQSVVSEPTALSVAISETDALCNGANDGTATVVAGGGTGTYTYAWSDGQTHDTAIGLVSGAYQVTVTDANGCTITSGTTVNEPTALSLMTSNTNASCNGGTNGSASVTASGGIGAYTYVWDANTGNQSTSTAINLSFGNYSVTVTDANNCQISTLVNVVEETAIDFTMTGSTLFCFGDSDGSAFVVVNSGTPPYNYLWSNGETTNIISDLTAGSYTVTLVDGTGCSAVDFADVTEPTELTVSLVGTDILCNGGTDGTATATPSGGTMPYTYLWSDGSTDATAPSLFAGMASVTITDGNNCQVADQVMLNEPAALQTSGNVIGDVLCNGGNDGIAFMAVVGGTVPYTFLWDTGETDATANALDQGDHDITITDANGCEVLDQVTIAEPPPLSAITNADSDVICNGEANGGASVVASGGTAPYTYLWDSGETAASAVLLDQGNHDVTITDANACEIATSVMITEPAAVSAIAVLDTDVACNGELNGGATVSGSGGVGPYTYFWDSGETTDAAVSLNAGSHDVTLTDANGCTTATSIMVSEPAALISSSSTTDVLCFGGNSGTATTAPLGGTAPYTYLWDNGSTDATAIDLTTSSYSVTITDANGCQTFDAALVIEPTELQLTSGTTPVNCFAGNDGTASVVPSGGVGGYTFSWDAGAGNQTTDIATDLPAGPYVVSVTDANGCEATIDAIVTEPAAPVSLTTTTTEVNCFAGTDGTASVVAAGGTGTYTYTWNDTNNQNSSTAAGLSTGSYIVSVTDANGCLETASVIVDEPAELEIQLSSTDESCFGADGTTSVVASGGTGAYTFQWSSGQNADVATGLSEGDYTIVVTDGNACAATAQITVAGPIAIDIDIQSLEVSCFGGADGEAVALATGGLGSFSYQWSDASGQLTGMATGLSTGTYIVTATDAGGCTETASIMVAEPTELLSSAIATEVGCFGGTDGTATVTANGGTPPYTYLWSDAGAQQTETASGLNAGMFTVVVVDNNGCNATSTVEVLEPIELTISSLTAIGVSCNSGSDGNTTAVAQGGTPPYTYLWNDANGQTTPTADGLGAGNYSVTVFDANACQVANSIQVTEPSAIVVALSQTASGCFEGSDGQASAVASGGTISTDYTFTWSNGSQGSTANSLVGGQTYTVTVTDDNGCQQTDAITIGQPDPVEIVVSSNDVSCFGGSDGNTNVIATGGTPPYTYNWSSHASGQTEATATDLPAGQYSVTVIDANDCTQSGFISIGQPARLDVEIETEDIKCKGDATGSAIAMAEGGSPGYAYQWSDADGQTTRTAEGLTAGSYTVTVTDVNNCEVINVIEIREPDEFLDVEFDPFDASCFGGEDGNLEVYGAGGTPPYEYSLDGENYNGSSLIVGLTSGIYTLYVRDIYGCVEDSTFVISEPEEFTISAGPESIIELGDSIQLFAVPNLDGDITYEWTTLTPDTSMSCRACDSPWVKPDYDVVYVVTATNENGCMAVDEVRVQVVKKERVFVANAFTPNNDGANDWFFVQGGRGTDLVLTFQVFDRWGEKVFETGNTPLNVPELGWDGTFKGEEMNPGVFAWFTEVLFSDGTSKVYKGDVTLLR